MSGQYFICVFHIVTLSYKLPSSPAGLSADVITDSQADFLKLKHSQHTQTRICVYSHGKHVTLHLWLCMLFCCTKTVIFSYLPSYLFIHPFIISADCSPIQRHRRLLYPSSHQTTITLFKKRLKTSTFDQRAVQTSQ